MKNLAIVFCSVVIAEIWAFAAIIHYCLPTDWLSQWYSIPVILTFSFITYVTIMPSFPDKIDTDSDSEEHSLFY